jgi:predicted RNA-binding protein with PUA-like domain
MVSHYLLKSEPLPRLEDGVDVSYPFSRLLTSPDQSTTWDGVRNPRAGKTLKGMKVGDEAFWYHSNTKLPEIVGVVKVTVDGENQPDGTAFDQVRRGSMRSSCSGFPNRLE